MEQDAQTVVYRLDAAHRPAWQFYSMPESIVGGGKTFEAARSEYLAALRFTLDTTDLPPVREYIEREIGSTGIWLRLPFDHPNFDGVLSEVERQIMGHPDDLPWFFANATAGGDPVVVTTAVDSPLVSLLDQMTAYDSLILTMLYKPPSGKIQTVWLALTGAESEAEAVEASTSFDALGLTPDSPVRDLLKVAMERQVRQISALVPC